MSAALKLLRLSGLAIVPLWLVGCSSMLPKPAALPAFYTIDVAPPPGAPAPLTNTAGAPTVLISPPRATSGYDSRQIVYVRQNHRLEYFARSQWVDTPARMFAPLLVTHLAATGGFQAVYTGAGAAAADLRLDTEIMALKQDFLSTPSSTHFVLRAQLIDGVSRRVIATRDIEAAVASASEDPYGGVVAANGAVGIVLSQLSAFCVDGIRNWRERGSAADRKRHGRQ